MTTRVQRADALERWADEVDADDLIEAQTASLRTIAALGKERNEVDTALLDAVRDGRSRTGEVGRLLDANAHRTTTGMTDVAPASTVSG